MLTMLNSTRPLPLQLTAVIATLLTLLALLVFPAPLAAQDTAPNAASTHLVPWNSGRWFLSGVNIPWMDGGYGSTFGKVEEWNQHTYNHAKAEAMFAELKAAGVNSVRWWVFADGRGAPEFSANSGGSVTGLDSTVLPSMEDAVRVAEKYDVYIVFNLWSFDMLLDDSTASGRGEHAGGHRDLIVDATKRKSFIDKALLPILKHPVAGTSYTIGTHPNVLGWDIMNEPEWAIRESNAVNDKISQPVSLAEMQRFIAEVSGTIHRNSNQLTTVGSAALKWNSDSAPGATGNWWKDSALMPYDAKGYLDFYQIHYYGWMNGDGKYWSYSPALVDVATAGFDKPTVIGEYPANADDSGFDPAGLLDQFRTNKYGGAWAWSYYDIDAAGSWPDIKNALSDFNSRYASEVRINTSEAAPAPSATSQPATATAAPSATSQPVIYSDALAAGWVDWSWDTNRNLKSFAQKKEGKYAIAVKYNKAWAGLYLHTDTPLSTNTYKRLRFWAHGGTDGGQPIWVSLIDGNGNTSQQVKISTLKAKQWMLIDLPLSQFGSPTAISGIVLQEAGGAARPGFYIDMITLSR